MEDYQKNNSRGRLWRTVAIVMVIFVPVSPSGTGNTFSSLIQSFLASRFFAPFKNENDRPAGVIVVVQDITEQEKLDSMRKEFMADVSHELKTPITSIMGYADTLIDSDVDEENQKKFLSRISSEAERMSKLVADLLILSKYDTAKIKVEKTEFDLGELVKYVFEGQMIEMQKKDLTGECYVTADVPPVYADKSGIERVVINILSNAIKYTQPRWKYYSVCWICL